MCSSFHCETWKFLISIPWYYWTFKNSSRTKTNPYFDPITLDFSCFSSNLTLYFSELYKVLYYVSYVHPMTNEHPQSFSAFFLTILVFPIFFFFSNLLFINFEHQISKSFQVLKLEIFTSYLLYDPTLPSNLTYFFGVLG